MQAGTSQKNGMWRDGAWFALLALALAPGVIDLARIWSSVDYYSHGFLVPLVAFWVARDRLRGVKRARDRRGLFALALAVAVYGTGLAGGLVELEGLGVVLAVAGAVWAAWGRSALRRLAFPLGFLIFMVPLPPAWLTPRIVDLQLWVSSAAVALLRGAGLGVAREGNVLLLASGESLFVEEACSGITSIVTLMPLGVVLAYFTLKRGWKRVALVGAVIPVAMLGNLVRVAATVAAADAWGAERATSGTLHESAGLLTFSLACLGLIGLGALLRRRS